MTTKTQGMTAEDLANDVNVVSLWTSVDKVRWTAGVISGWIAAAVAMVVGGLIATTSGLEFLFPVKLLGTCLLGPSATAYGNTAGLLAGVLMTGLLGAFWGFVYGHFVRANTAYAFLGMGFTWGAFLWIFNWNLFMHSVKAISAAEVPSGAAFAVCLAYGFALSVIGVVDPAIRGK